MDTSESARPARRSAGILLHPTSLPAPGGIGDLGPAAYAWVDALVRARQSWWQILPLGPTGYGDSPYAVFSAFAGNPNLISPELLVREGLLDDADFVGVAWPADYIDYGPAIAYKAELTALAWDKFQAGRSQVSRSDFEEFRVREAGWLDDFALFMALKEVHGGLSWHEWPEELILRDPDALQLARQELAEEMDLHRFRQFLFHRQWTALRQYARECKIRLIGDVPIFVADDSADVWTHPELFLLDERRLPKFVSGVPPDYFSKTGQLWGNPLYDWEVHRRDGYSWWTARLQAALAQVDLIRLDHFRGFESYWEVPAGEPTAEKGRWVAGPGADFFQVLRDKLGGLPFLAEDLGVITPRVRQLRHQFELPGMRVLQFAFGGATELRFLPHRHERNTVVYTGTHDNDTTHGWQQTLTEEERHFLHRYAPSTDNDISWVLIRLAWMSVADYAIAPLQDVLSLGNEARMNRPGTPSGNWRWRFRADLLREELLERLAELTVLYERG
ncbi:MAG: 4-alpha-glucanotransferase [Gemmataceae bacterium]